ncbi:MAG: O-antigen ligase family protein [Bacillota bacterium]|nr:O-antigen ligase family protein [Bacillota bacterium]
MSNYGEIKNREDSKTEYDIKHLKKWMYYDNLLLVPIFYLFYDYLLRSFFIDSVAVQLWDEMMLVFFIGILFKEILIENKYWWRVPIGAFFLLGIIGIAGSGYYGRSTIDGYRLIYQPILWGAYLFVIFQRPAVFEKVKTLMIVIGGFLSIHGLLQIMFKVPMLGNWVDTTDVIQHRAFSILNSPNSLGSFMVMHVGFLLGLIFIEKNKRKQIILTMMAFISITTLYLTYSRGAILAIVAAIALILMIFNKRLLLYFAFLGTGLLLLVNQGAYRFYNLFTPDTVSNMMTDGRLAKWSEGMQEFILTPIFGKGYGQFGGSIAIKYGISNFYADNFYLKSLVENGIFGMIIFMLFMGYFLYRLLKNRKNYFLVGISIAVLGFLLHNFVDNLYGIPTLTFYFYVYLAMGVSQINDNSGDVIL